MYLGDFSTGANVQFAWNSNAVAGESITRGTNGTLQVYKNGSTAYSTVGVTDMEDFAALTGVHHCMVDTTADGAFYTTASEFIVALSGATIDSKAINAALAHFSLNNRACLRPTVAGRTLDVSSSGNAGIDFGNVDNSTATNAFSATTISTSQAVASVAAAVALSTTQIIAQVTGSVGSVGSNVTLSTQQIIAQVTGAVGSVGANVTLSTQQIIAQVTGAVGSVAAAVALTTAERDSLSQAILTADIDSYEASTNKSVTRMAAMTLNKKALTSTQLTVYKTDGLTSYYTQAVTSSTTLNPISATEEIA